MSNQREDDSPRNPFEYVASQVADKGSTRESVVEQSFSESLKGRRAEARQVRDRWNLRSVAASVIVLVFGLVIVDVLAGTGERYVSERTRNYCLVGVIVFSQAIFFLGPMLRHWRNEGGDR